MAINLEGGRIERRGVIRNKEIAAPKDGDRCFTLLSESFWRF